MPSIGIDCACWRLNYHILCVMVEEREGSVRNIKFINSSQLQVLSKL